MFLGSGLLFLAMMFATVGGGRRAGRTATSAVAGTEINTDVALFGQMTVLALSKTYAVKMAAVFMMSLATIWLRTELDAALAGRHHLPCRAGHPGGQ